MRRSAKIQFVKPGPALALALAVAVAIAAGWADVAAQSADAQAEPGVTARALVRTDALRLRPGDVIRLQVLDEPGLSGDFGVNEAGLTLLPMLGQVRIAGRAFGDVRAEIRAGYAAHLVDPVVVVTPLVRVAVLGEVRAPGLVPVDPTLSVSDLLAMVGGLLPTADLNRISLVRGGEVLTARLDPGSGALDIPLQSGDQVVVGRQGFFRENLAIFVGAAASVAAAAVTSLILR